MKSIILSVKPKWAEKILNGEKTIEVRKSAPKELPFKVYLYCTKDRRKNYFNLVNHYGQIMFAPKSWDNILNGKVIAEFVCDKVDEIKVIGDTLYSANNIFANKLKNMCLSIKELKEYLGNKNGVAIGIYELKVYDKPKELGEFRKPCGDCLGKCTGEHYNRCAWQTLTRPPQSWQYCEELE